MPLDSLGFPPSSPGQPAPPAQPTPSPYAVFRQRRESAAAFWRQLPNARLDMRVFSDGPRGCALGLLALEGLDGWFFSARFCGVHVISSLPVAPSGRRFISGAAEWFGLDYGSAVLAFRGDHRTTRFYGRWFSHRITTADLGRGLLALPYRAERDEDALPATAYDAMGHADHAI